MDISLGVGLLGELQALSRPSPRAARLFLVARLLIFEAAVDLGKMNENYK